MPDKQPGSGLSAMPRRLLQGGGLPVVSLQTLSYEGRYMFSRPAFCRRVRYFLLQKVRPREKAVLKQARRTYRPWAGGPTALCPWFFIGRSCCQDPDLRSCRSEVRHHSADIVIAADCPDNRIHGWPGGYRLTPPAAFGYINVIDRIGIPEYRTGAFEGRCSSWAGCGLSVQAAAGGKFFRGFA